MVDIMNMEDIFNQLIVPIVKQIWVHAEGIDEDNMKLRCKMLAEGLIKEMADFVEAQQTIECNNCKGKKFKTMKEPWQVL